MVGEFVFVSDVGSICQWANTLMVAVVFLPLFILALVSKVIPYRRSGLFKLELPDESLEPGSLKLRKPKVAPEEQEKIEAGETEVLLPGLGDGQQLYNR